LQYKISVNEFQGARSEHAIASQWAILEDMYCQLLLTFSKGPDESAAIILERIYHAVVTADIVGLPDLRIKVQDLMAWIDGGESSWFFLVHTRYGFTLHNELPLTLFCIRARGSAVIQKRVTNLRQQTVRASASSSGVSHHSHPSLERVKHSSTRSGSSGILGNLYQPTPPPPGSEPASAQLPSQNESSSVQDEFQENDGPRVDPNIAPIAEMMRESQATTRANIDLAYAKAAYLRTQAQATSLTMFKELLKQESDDRERQRVVCMEISKDPTMDTKVQEAAKEFICQYITGALAPIDYVAVFNRLNRHLPGLEDIANVFLNAPALAPGAFEEHHASNLRRIAGAAEATGTASRTTGPAPARNPTA
jgi:hypothetical protein